MLEKYTIHFPKIENQILDQDEEFFIIEDNSKNLSYKIRFHEYNKIYSIPGLYEYLFYNKLKCCSPKTICTLLNEEINKSQINMNELSVLDIGAGNGIVGEQLLELGVKNVYGIDIIEEAVEAVNRDRGEVYRDYFIVNLCDIPNSIYNELKLKKFNCLTCVAALGFGDIPPKAFATGFNLLLTPAWVAFNIKKEFFDGDYSSDFSKLINNMIENNILELKSLKFYRHRLSMQGNPIHYAAIIGRKLSNIPEEWFWYTIFKKSFSKDLNTKY